jgi:hypothetical protein
MNAVRKAKMARRPRYQQLWMIEVRKKGSNQLWQATGRDWYWRRSEALKAISEITWTHLEYRATKYVSAGRPR